ncbi:MAG: 3-phosphoserine/phosphohydroxythreonine transaminase [Myxococcales bacterium]|nr:3-phosphoserine/phosphohydroxythreonine transaminase [Myxococcales bacterium]
MTHRAMNFNAGPAGLPLEALEETREALLDLDHTGIGVLEHSHRGAAYERVHQEAQGHLRALLGLDEAWSVLLLQGGASQVFATLPMNFLKPGQRALYAVTGGWGEKALEEAQRLGDAVDVTPMAKQYRRIPAAAEHRVEAGAAYLHFTSNNTLEGTQYDAFPTGGGAPVVCDMSSDILWRPTDLSGLSMVYAGAQKNIGPSGLVVVLVRRDWLAEARRDIATIFRFATHDANGSLYNTPNTFAVYLTRCILRNLLRDGGLAEAERRNRAKAARLYSALDAEAGFYTLPVERPHRSAMNVVWRLGSPELDARFVKEAEREGMFGLKGHRSTGGIRASLYNAVTLGDVEALAQFVTAFARRNG